MGNPNRRRRARVRLLLMVVFMHAAAIDCAPALAPQPLERFENCEALEEFLEERIVEGTRPQLGLAFNPFFMFYGCAAGSDEAPKAGEGEGEGTRNDSDGGGRSYSETNTQEVDVDEPDIVKNDGDTLYAISGGDVYVLDAWPPADASISTRIDVKGVALDMLFADDRLLVIGRDDEQWGVTILSLYDVSDPTEPTLLRISEIDGQPVDTRRVGDEVLVVTSSHLNTYIDGLGTGFFQDDRNRAVIEKRGIDGMFPKIRDQIFGVDDAPRVENASSCTNTYAPANAAPTSMLLVHTLSMTDETAPIKATGVIAPFSHVYASTEAIYMSAVEWWDGGYFTPEYAVTRIHKLAAFQGDGAAEYEGTGTFYGQVRDEMSLDEQDGRLRVVISDDGQSTDPLAIKTALLVLEDDGDALVEVGRVDDIGKGEAVQAVRFIGEFAYVVTYPAGGELWFDENGVPGVPFVDPLFVIDLSKPTEPRLRGELEVDGYSTYIHPLGDDHLLTIGVATDKDTGAYLGMNLSIFDVDDPDRPTLAHRMPIGDSTSGSEALTERHAFTYFEEDSVLAIPYVAGADTEGMRTGTLLVGVDVDEGLTNRGLIDQSTLSEPGDDFTPWCRMPRRNVFIKDETIGTFVFTVATNGIAIAALDDPTTIISQVHFDGPTDCGTFE